jgi:glycerate 2-kinase
MIFQPEQFITSSLQRSPSGKKICQVLAAAINNADAGAGIRNKVSLAADKLIVDNLAYDLKTYKRIFVIGAGKAVVPMTATISEILGNRITSGVVIYKDGYFDANFYILEKHIKILQAGHPIPDQRNVDGSSRILSLIQNLAADDLVICLLSGGGSSLMMKPASGLSLKDFQDTIALLLTCGATIGEINTLRKHLDDLKGGGLAKSVFPATVISLLLSDVVGDYLDVIASGPTVADPTTFRDAWVVLNKYQLVDQIPHHVLTHLSDGLAGKIHETIKPGDPILDNVQNVLIGSNSQAALAVFHFANDLGFTTKIMTTGLQGEASQVGQTIAKDAKTMLTCPEYAQKSACLIAGGETTVTIKGPGKGGRNQEIALGAVESLSGPQPFVLVSLATDGGDGPTDAAGAVATNLTYSRGLAIGLNPTEYLERNDSYHYFESLGDLIKTGPTLNNVNDLVFIFTV